MCLQHRDVEQVIVHMGCWVCGEQKAGDRGEDIIDILFLCATGLMEFDAWIPPLLDTWLRFLVLAKEVSGLSPPRTPLTSDLT